VAIGARCPIVLTFTDVLVGVRVLKVVHVVLREGLVLISVVATVPSTDSAGLLAAAGVLPMAERPDEVAIHLGFVLGSQIAGVDVRILATSFVSWRVIALVAVILRRVTRVLDHARV
jgi:hypothetical protein